MEQFRRSPAFLYLLERFMLYMCVRIGLSIKMRRFTHVITEKQVFE